MAKAPVCCHKPRLQLDFTGFVEDLSVSECMHINVQIVVCICRKKKYIYIYNCIMVDLCRIVCWRKHLYRCVVFCTYCKLPI